MKLLFQTLCLCLALGLAATQYDRIAKALHLPEAHHDAKLDRCEGLEFDAIAPDESGVMLFFKGDHVWKGFQGQPELINSSFKELEDHHHLGHVDAAFRMHYPDNTDHHDHTFFFLDDTVFSYYQKSLEKGFPKDISEVFPGVPSHLDAAVECPKGECVTDSVLFFKENQVFHYDTRTKTVKTKVWSHLPNCTSALRWLEHYYCFSGHEFTRFHPVTGTVVGEYPKDARKYFMRCPNFGHGSNHTSQDLCKNTRVDAITSDDLGKAYAFRGNLYMRLDTHRDGWHSFPISNTWKEVSGDVDAVFTYDGKVYIIKGDQVYIYKSGPGYALIEGYPKSLKEELGVEGPVDAAFVCGEHEIAHVIKDDKMYDIDLTVTPRVIDKEALLPFKKVNAGMCGPDGVKIFVDEDFYRYETPQVLAFSRIRPEPHKISREFLGCEH
ncbi:hemopexin-like [Clupea harengus]|uniref:Hemopexin n=1 Tax=Clupea harengus TaxID=7950 RepID=A0A6P3WFP4_CLUHA|nr:hemopexin-like [Clupea harengus]